MSNLFPVSVTKKLDHLTAISSWCKQFREECLTSPKAKDDYDSMKENLRLKKENEELRKEVAFLKKAAAFFAREID